MSTENLLVELFVEELPPKSLKKLGQAFAQSIVEGIKAQGLTTDNAVMTSFATPRRLAVHITDVASKAADKQVAQKLMPVKIGLDADGNATPALLKRLSGLGLDESAVADLRKEGEGKAESLFLDITKTGATLEEGLQQSLDDAIAKLPIPKVMTYQINDGWESVNFVRPAHGLVALHGSDVVTVNALGLTASNTSKGHRFEAKEEVVTFKHADIYEAQLKTEGAVIASYETRKADIAAQLKAAADKEGLTPIEDEELLDEVTALVELPNVLLGQYETEFLDVPQECLILTMKANQKYFPLLDADGKLTSKFLITSNIKPADPSAVIGGNERVVRPRLADAKFFFDQDRKKTLESRVASLSKVVYHNKLGSQGERNARVINIATTIAEKIGDLNLAAKVETSARLSKADLITDMVGEFPKLQGVMGRYYAQAEGLDDDVAYAIEDHYKPNFAGDALPRNQAGICVALADKLETLVGLFSIGEKPTGDKDPFALRRHALGIIRLLIDAKLDLNLKNIISIAYNVFNDVDLQKEWATKSNDNKPDSSTGNTFFSPTVFQQRVFDADAESSVYSFVIERLSNMLREQKGSSLEVDAVLSLKPELLSEVPLRLEAVRTFASLAEAPALAAANKRVGNILKKIDGEVKAQIDNALLQEPQEKALAEALAKTKPEADKHFESGDYTASLQALAGLKGPVDEFFDNVMVNADDPALKANRQGMLATLHQAMNRVADLSKLAS